LNATTSKAPRKKLSRTAKRGIWIVIVVAVIVATFFGTKIVRADDPLAQGAVKFSAETFGADNFPAVQEGIIDRAVEADALATAIAEDAAAASDKYGVPSSGGPVFSTTFTGVVGEGQSGIYDVDVAGVPDDLLIRVQTGPAINGTELRDATGEIKFGQFTNQIDYQNAAAALNEVLKSQVLVDLDTTALTGKTITITGALTLVNPAAWLVTPVELEIQ
jgi:predicted lipoprotein